MRVAFVSMETTHHRDTQGNRRLERVAGQLAERGHDVEVYCASSWDSEGSTMSEDGVVYHGVVSDPSPRLFALRLTTLLPGRGVDVIHASPRPPVAVAGARVASALARAPLVVDWYGDEGLEESRWTSYAATAPSCVVTPSEMVRTRVREYGTTADATRVIPEGIDVDILRDTEPDSDGPDVVYTHALDDSANAESLLLALAELRDHDWSAAIVGDGPERDRYERQAIDLRIDDRVQFLGEQSTEERVALYRGAHAFVQTAYECYFPTELLWALAAGCVGIVEYQAESSAHELIENYARSFRVTNPQELADAIVDAGQFGRQDYVSEFDRFDHDEILASYLDCYRDVQESHGLF
ncbi:glycosyltransferase family 4 protein [Haloarculaceae archaeon H-GB2-1]|nr:glycosyltransferase family 4 protein [Haloarculaceae archaeon H-GB1-1]MEA5387755.1 glycosyltransferase family 4 protein [Haloarculaceae archaeon H-GB11]MEA5409248.1 glycosyltransferase family 4 protein [Haloarculaceae archaeon H-GB2-1]